MIKATIVGATAFTSCELISLLLRHPEAELIHLGGRREGTPVISSIFPSLRGRCDLKLLGLDPGDAPCKPDVAFFTLPHGVSNKYVSRYLEAGIRCIDFSGDYRLKDIDVYNDHYGDHGDPENIKRAVYGLPELFRKRLSGADLVANPGCYPTSVLLALAPFVQADAIEPGVIIVDAKSGVSGRGNKPTPGSLYCECNENIKAYGIGSHRHTPEMAQGIELLGGTGSEIIFTPHLVPMDRGILSTIYVQLKGGAPPSELGEIMAEYYAGEPFIRVLPDGEQPATRDVTHTNYCDMAVEAVGGDRAVITSAIDNLSRGAASQAVQNMNIALGIEESAGLL